MKNIINKDIFIDYINALEEQKRYVDDLNKILNKYTNKYTTVEYFYPRNCSCEVIELLEFIFDDVGEWIAYFCYQLDYGKNYKDGDIIIDNKNVSLSSAAELYDFLVENMRG